MKTFILLAACISFNASATTCIGSNIKLNDDTFLTGEGLYDQAQKRLYDINFLTDNKLMGTSIPAKDSKGKETHKVIVLGGTQDAGGIISVSYLVKDNAGKEVVYLLNSSYDGSGSMPKSQGPETTAKQDRSFRILMTAGCGKTL